LSALSWIQAHGCQSQTTLPRAALGLIAGAFTGASLVAVGVPTVIYAMQFPEIGSVGAPGVFIFGLMAAFPVAFVAFAVGLSLIAPVWWGLHSLGMRCWSIASPLGALAAGGVTLLVTQHLLLGLAMATTGAITGAVIWKVAYRPAGVCGVAQ
jgi:hypothetical protein